jgi:hypothetical protein
MKNYIKLPFILNVNGFCGSGKSWSIQYLIKSMKNELNCIVVFSNTAAFTNDYEFLNEMGEPSASSPRDAISRSGCVPISSFVFSSLDADSKLKKIMAIQKKNRIQDRPRNVLIIFDDIFGSIKDSKTFKDLVTTFRHYRISIIFSAQYISASATYLREISNFIIIFNQRTMNALKITYENYFVDEYETFGEFKAAFKNKLKDFHFYFIDRIQNKKYIMVCPSKI